MANRFMNMSDTQTWRIMVAAVLEASRQQGLTLTRVPGRGRSNVWEASANGKESRVSIRTTRNRWFAFPPLKKGKKWKTLDDVDMVFVAAVDDRDDPRRIEVYRFDAPEVREHFDAAYEARVAAGLAIKDNFGMWINLDEDRRRTPVSVGSGLAANHKPVAIFDIDVLVEKDVTVANCFEGNADIEDHATEPDSIGKVMERARQRIARLSGVPIEAVKLDVKIEY